MVQTTRRPSAEYICHLSCLRRSNSYGAVCAPAAVYHGSVFRWTVRHRCTREDCRRQWLFKSERHGRKNGALQEDVHPQTTRLFHFICTAKINIQKLRSKQNTTYSRKFIKSVLVSLTITSRYLLENRKNKNTSQNDSSSRAADPRSIPSTWTSRLKT